ncbi:MAG: nucleoside-diphosphate kinase [Elusimicrobia bacterium GWA2_69_24]|nr:MAG: nucleoside-diphosphate kinase [Elusimicrobia bacterium GWA2_69_24]HBL16597.1 nucleoside-diphosphate kinase [Elusimicrobiota bacterium]
MEQTLVLIKPDGAKRKLTGLVIDRLDGAGLRLVAAKVVSVSEELARRHYRMLKDKPFFENLIQYIRGKFHEIPDSQILALVYEGEGAIARVRQAAGATNPEEAAPGTIRGSFGRVTTKGQFENVVHASGNAEDAEFEVKLWFTPAEVLHPIYPVTRGNGTKAEAAAWS